MFSLLFLAYKHSKVPYLTIVFFHVSRYYASVCRDTMLPHLAILWLFLCLSSTAVVERAVLVRSIAFFVHRKGFYVHILHKAIEVPHM